MRSRFVALRGPMQNESVAAAARSRFQGRQPPHGAFVRPKAEPPAAICSTVAAAPKLLYVGRGVTITLHLAQKGKAAEGVGLNVRTKACKGVRIGITGVFTPPVTG